MFTPISIDFLNIDNPSQETFKKIAEQLFNKYAIQKGDIIYRLIDIEFYWHSDDHPDHSVYKRIHVHPKAGDWFFHYSGVDIALGDENSGGYGGILIRGIQNMADSSSKGFTKGPMVCAMKLFSETSAFSASITTRIIDYQFDESSIISSERIGLGQNAKTTGADKFLYRFFIPPVKK